VGVDPIELLLAEVCTYLVQAFSTKMLHCAPVFRGDIPWAYQSTGPRCGAEMEHGTVGGRSTWWRSRNRAALPDRADQR
jgi:hypothetical protein